MCFIPIRGVMHQGLLLPLLAVMGLLVSGTHTVAEDKDEKPFVLNGDATKGVQVYKVFCAACHGENGDGKGPAAAALNPKPADYTDHERMSKLADKDLYTVVKDGGAAVGKSALMVPWKTSLTDQQIRDVVAHIRTLAKKPE